MVEPVDHPLIRPSINVMAKTYDLAAAQPELGTVMSPFTGERVICLCYTLNLFVKFGLCHDIH